MAMFCGLYEVVVLSLILSFVLSAYGGLDNKNGDGAKLVDLKAVDFSIRVEMPYATPNNFTKHKVYSEEKCVLRREVALALSRVQAALRMQDLSLKVYDCYRPLSVQKTFWKLVPDERYVANPDKGSRHNRGAAVDVTLTGRSGLELDMPSAFDDFSNNARRDNPHLSPTITRNLKALESAMKKEGFVGLPTEWWHFDYNGWEKFEIEDIPFSAIK
jgi:zinc D-Ala-D-Ala dipeptidase